VNYHTTIVILSNPNFDAALPCACNGARKDHNMFGANLSNLLRGKKKQLVFANIELEKQTQTLNAQVQEWKGKLEMAKV
jgi:hypothetical protein